MSNPKVIRSSLSPLDAKIVKEKLAKFPEVLDIVLRMDQRVKDGIMSLEDPEIVSHHAEVVQKKYQDERWMRHCRTVARSLWIQLCRGNFCGAIEIIKQARRDVDSVVIDFASLPYHDFVKLSIHEIGIEERLTLRLEDAGINTVSDLLSTSVEYLTQSAEIGEVSVNHIREVLQRIEANHLAPQLYKKEVA